MPFISKFCVYVFLPSCVCLLMHLQHKTYTSKMGDMIGFETGLGCKYWVVRCSNSSTRVRKCSSPTYKIGNWKYRKSSSVGQQRHTLDDTIKLVNQNFWCAEVFTLAAYKDSRCKLNLYTSPRSVWFAPRQRANGDRWMKGWVPKFIKRKRDCEVVNCTELV